MAPPATADDGADRTDRPRRVLVVSHYYDPEPLPKAGELARALHRRGHDVRVVTGLPTYPAGRLADGHRLAIRHDEVRDAIPVRRTFEVPYHGPSPAGRALNYASTAVSLVAGATRGWSPDAVYVWAPPPTTVAPARVLAALDRWLDPATRGRRVRPPVVVDVQDLWPDFGLLAGLLHEGPAVRALRSVERWSYRRADRLVVPTEGYRRAVVDRGIDPAHVEVLPNWIPDRDAVEPDPAAVAAVRTAEGWDDRFVVLFAGNLGHAQGLDAVLDAAAATDAPDVVWAFAGDGADRARLEELARRRDLDDRVRFLGRRDPASMPALAGAADALLVHLRPSPLAEVVVPTKVNGYLAYGRPILCALGGEGAALVERAGAGVVVAGGDGDAIWAGARQLRDLPPAERDALGRRGRELARRELVRSVLLPRYESVLGLDRDGDDRRPPRAGRPDGDPIDPAATVTVGRAPSAAVVGPVTSPRRPVLVTGATGSLGPHVVAALRDAGCEVRVLVRRPGPATEDVEVVIGDLRDPDAVERAVAGCDTVVHLAAIAHRRGPDVDRQHDEVTGTGATTVFAAAEAAGCRRVVFTSSIAVYGPHGSLAESSPLRPATAYARAKVRAERDLAARTAPDGQPLGVVLRLATCYGPGAAGNVTRMADALARHRFVVIGPGTARKSLLHVDDAAAAVVLATVADRAAGRTYDVSDGRPRPMAEIVDELCADLGRTPPRWRIPAAPVRVALQALERTAGAAGRRAPVGPDVLDTFLADVAVPATRIRDELGFRPRHQRATAPGGSLR